MYKNLKGPAVECLENGNYQAYMKENECLPTLCYKSRNFLQEMIFINMNSAVLDLKLI